MLILHCCTYLIHHSVEMRIPGVEPVQIGVKCEIRERLPWRFVAVDVDGTAAGARGSAGQRRFAVADGRRRHHRNAVHRAVRQFTAILKQKK